MATTPFKSEDIGPFLALAHETGWICEPWEFEFLLQTFPQGCWAWRENGVTAGCVTSIRHGKSGWVGNLLVQQEFRRRGIGRVLMEQAVVALLKEGVETVWLTASADGAGLYRKLGFVEIDTICRWEGRGKVNGPGNRSELDREAVRGIDRVGWGDKRDLLLKISLDQGGLFTSSGGFLCCRRWKNGVQLGPWGCLIPSQAAPLLDKAITKGKEKIFLDVPAGNYAATSLLKEKGFEVRGTNLLMYLGAEPQYQPGSIYALASMGSMG